MTRLEIKTQARRDVHAALAGPCTYTAPSNNQPVGYGKAYGQSYGGTPAGVPLTARLHDKMLVSGGTMDQPGYGTLIEGVLNAIFNREELAAAGVTLVRGGRVVFPDVFGPGQDAVYELDNRSPYDGPIDEKWSLAPP